MKTKIRTDSLFCLFCLFFALAQPALHGRTFKEEQLRFVRVRGAYQEKEQGLQELFQKKGLAYPPKAIFIRVFKQEYQLEVWARQENEGKYALLKTYPICALSGTLGPKRRSGDYQVPEGFYHINLFNPVSRFHLSMQINYPNESDRILGIRGDLGGTIFIHGHCVTIGCIPIRDENIKEVYLLAVEARSAGQSAIPVHIFPLRLSEAKLKWLKSSYAWGKSVVSLWDNLKEGYDFFEHGNKLPRVSVDRQGRSQFE